jgi:squalene-hopene/tetraprenyl-beta-curcumene cyclase
VSATEALAAARDHLRKLQHPDGWWKAELETNVTMDAEDLLLRHFLGILEPDLAAASAQWIRGNQRQDGTWATFYGGPPDLSTTIEAYVGLRLAGDDPTAAHMAAAAAWVRANGGIAASRVFTRIWLAIVGQWRWEDLPVLPPEIMFLPPWAPLNVYSLGCWARQTVVALTMVMAHRPARVLPFDLHDLDPAEPSAAPAVGAVRGARHTVAGLAGATGAAGRFEALDTLLHRYERLPRWFLPRTPLRRAALDRAERWVVRRQEADGLWGGIQPPVVYSIMALHLQGYAVDHPVIQAALNGLEDFVIHDHRGRRLEACQSPVWDTALAVVALTDAGVDPEDPAVADAARWLVNEEVRVPGDWSVRRPGLAPGGWAFEFANDHYPDIDDTAEVVLALRRAYPHAAAAASASPLARAITADAGLGSEAMEACSRGVDWTLGMQCRQGGWGAFDVDNDSAIVAALPFCDFGEVTDPPSADVTAHVIEMLAESPGVPAGPLQRGVEWLWGQQEADGSWFGRWGVNYLYGTGAALPALVAAGVPLDDPRLGRAVDWLVDHQNADGGWGEDLRSYIDESQHGRGASTASQTAWALLALIAAGQADHRATAQGVAWLVEQQRPDGTWDEPWFTGTGFPWDFSINYHLYRLVWPVMALGRYVRATGGLDLDNSDRTAVAEHAGTTPP